MRLNFYLKVSHSYTVSTLIIVTINFIDMLKKAEEIALKLPTDVEEAQSRKIAVPSQPPSIDHMTLLDHTHHNPMSLLAGSSLSVTTTQVIDINTKQLLFELSCSTHACSSDSETLHGLAFVGSEAHVFVTCSGEDGRVKLWDTRESLEDGRTTLKGQESCVKSNSSSPRLTYALAVGSCSVSNTKIAVLGSDGHLSLYDSRSRDVPLTRYSVKREDGAFGFKSRFSAGGRVSTPCVQVSQHPCSTTCHIMCMYLFFLDHLPCTSR